MEAEIRALKEQGLAAARACESLAELERVRLEYLGRKGKLTQILRGLSDLAPEERRQVGSAANAAKRELSDLVELLSQRATDADRKECEKYMELTERIARFQLDVTAYLKDRLATSSAPTSAPAPEEEEEEEPFE